jgi:hypothetical protein
VPLPALHVKRNESGIPSVGFQRCHGEHGEEGIETKIMMNYEETGSFFRTRVSALILLHILIEYELRFLF